jgi:Arc/MetJ-type ribon-helix-helix transcriptional regulator
MVQLTDDLVRRLDEVATQRGTSRSSLIREAVEALLTSSSERTAVEHLVASYRTLPQASPDVWGDLARSSDVATRETMQRLDAEEAAGGFPPW